MSPGGESPRLRRNSLRSAPSPLAKGFCFFPFPACRLISEESFWLSRGWSLQIPCQLSVPLELIRRRRSSVPRAGKEAIWPLDQTPSNCNLSADFSLRLGQVPPPPTFSALCVSECGSDGIDLHLFFPAAGTGLGLETPSFGPTPHIPSFSIPPPY